LRPNRRARLAYATQARIVFVPESHRLPNAKVKPYGRADPVLKLTAMLIAAAFIVGAACKKSGGFDTPLNPSAPPAGLDTTQAQMKDGAGNPGPVRARLLTVRPDLNSTVVGGTGGDCNSNSPFNCFQLQAEICMDAVSNPTNSPLLNSMKIGAVFSADGTNPIMKGGFPYPVGPPGQTVTPGACTTMLTQSGMSPEMPGPSQGVPRFLILVAGYGNATFFTLMACPTPDSITNNNLTNPPACSFQRAYDLGYHF
jgi:hypothetical protein